MITGQFNDSFPPIMDGVANVVKNYAYWLNKKHGQSFVITPSYPKYIDNEDFKVFRYKSIPLLVRKPYRIGLPKFSIKTKKEFEKINFDIIHSHSPFSAGTFAKMVAKEKRVPVVTTFHSKLYDDFKQQLKLKSLSKIALNMAMEFYNSVDYVWAVNKGSANTLKEYGYSGFIDVLPNGTDFSYPSDYLRRKEQVNDKLKLTMNETILLFTGQIVWQKNIRMVLQAIKVLKDNNLKFKIIFAGDGPAKAEFLQLIKLYEIENNVIYIGLILDRDYLKSLFARADLFVFPSVYDNAPIVVNEASALKCPSLLIKNTNAAEGVIDDENGFLCENSVEDFVKKATSIINNKQKLIEVGEKAYKTLYRDWESIVDIVYKRYDEIIEDCK